MVRWLCLALVVTCGCHTPLMLPQRPEGRGPADSAEQLWLKGQKAMNEGQPRQAIVLYEESLRRDGTWTKNYLSLAAAHLAQGDEQAASVHLAQFLQANPEHGGARLYQAELLLKRGAHAESRCHFEQVVAAAQDTAGQNIENLLHCLGRLTEIAEAQQDEYALHLHRGIGLYVLARGLAANGMDQSVFSSEALLCKAAAELTHARNLRPDEARPCWYLYSVWHRLAQTQQASRYLKDAQQAAPFTYLSPAEHRSLELACRGADRKK